jgi:hypothetical protein
MADINMMKDPSIHRLEQISGPVGNSTRAEMSGSVRAHLQIHSTTASRSTKYFYGQPENTETDGFKGNVAGANKAVAGVKMK